MAQGMGNSGNELPFLAPIPLAAPTRARSLPDAPRISRLSTGWAPGQRLCTMPLGIWRLGHVF